MRISFRSGVMGAAVLLSMAGPAAAGNRTRISIQQQTAIVKHLLSAANERRLAQVQSIFTESSIVQVGTHQWRGRINVMKWWRSEINHVLRIALRSALHGTRNEGGAIVHRQTSGGDCSNGCDEQAQWRFSGARINRMQLTSLPAPGLPRVPTIVVPPPPTAPPSPRVTPTIPS